MKNTQSESLHYLGPQQGEAHPASVMQNRYLESKDELNCARKIVGCKLT